MQRSNCSSPICYNTKYMSKELRDIQTIKRKILPILKEAQVRRSSLFGSIVHGDATAKSDVDLLVELPPHQSLLDFVDLKLKLEETLGCKVDLVEYETIKPLLKKQIINEQVLIL